MECKRLLSVNRTVSLQLMCMLVLNKAVFMMGSGIIE